MPAFLAPVIVPTLVAGAASIGLLSLGKAADETSGLVSEVTKLLLVGGSVIAIAAVARKVIK